MNTAYIPAITNNFQLYNNERNKENIDFINKKIIHKYVDFNLSVHDVLLESHSSSQLS